MEITSGIIEGPQKIVVYGPEGIGKSSLAAMFPNSLFIDTEGSTKRLNVRRTQAPSSWTMLKNQVDEVKKNPHLCDTLVIDTADWAEQLCISHICAQYNKDGIEDFGYGKGYVYIEEEFGRLLNSLNDLIDRGINVVMTAHAQTRKFEQPDEMGAYDRYEFKLEKKTAPLVKEWADMVLFVNYKTFVVNTGKDGKGTNKAQGGKRVIYSSHHVCWDAKNRHGLPEEMKFDSPADGFAQIAHCIPARVIKPAITQQVSQPVQEPMNLRDLPDEKPETSTPEPIKDEPKVSPQSSGIDRAVLEALDIPQALIDLMIQDNVSATEIQKAVAAKGYYPVDTPIAKYDSSFINGVLIGAWPQVFKMISEQRGSTS